MNDSKAAELYRQVKAASDDVERCSKALVAELRLNSNWAVSRDEYGPILHNRATEVSLECDTGEDGEQQMLVKQKTSGRYAEVSLVAVRAFVLLLGVDESEVPQ